MLLTEIPTFDDGGRGCCVRLARRGGGAIDRQDGKRVLERGEGVAGFGDDLERAGIGRVRQHVRRSDDVERAAAGGADVLPRFPRDGGTDPGRVAHRDREGKDRLRHELAADDGGLALQIAQVAFRDQSKLSVEETVADLVARGQVRIA